jgi:Ser/Thr protein kinase RdoA (MazF antagonist)
VTAELTELLGYAEYIESIGPNTAPLRNTHGDLKFNNLLFGLDDCAPRAVVDLDTCGPGYLYFDFGDLLRAGCATAEEDDVQNIAVQGEYLLALAEGFLENMQFPLTAQERQQLPHGPAVLALTLAARFLADYLNGDRYFSVAYPTANLQRARGQLKLGRLLVREAPRIAQLL